MTRVAIPNYAAKPKGRIFVVAPIAAILIAAGIWGLPKVIGRGSNAPLTGLPTYTVQPMNLDIHVIKDGELQAVNNIDITCQVEGQTTIVQLVKEGSSVKKGDVLAILDSSQIKQKMEDTSLDLQKATADLTAASSSSRPTSTGGAGNSAGTGARGRAATGPGSASRCCHNPSVTPSTASRPTRGQANHPYGCSAAGSTPPVATFTATASSTENSPDVTTSNGTTRCRIMGENIHDGHCIGADPDVA
jgi:hypothetical protein